MKTKETTWQELENAVSIHMEGHSLCAHITTDKIAFSFDGVILGAYALNSGRFGWQSDKYTSKRTTCRKFVQGLAAGTIKIA